VSFSSRLRLVSSGNSLFGCHSEEQGDEESLGSWVSREILRGVHPERLDLSSSAGLVEGLRMTMWSFQIRTRLIASSHLRGSNLIPTLEPIVVGDVHQR